MYINHLFSKVLATFLVGAGCVLAADKTSTPDYITFSGVSDTSAGVVIGTAETGYKILVGDDEDADLRIFSPTGGKPEKTLPIKDQLSGVKGKKEFDLEGAARIGNTVYWISSHGRSSKGKKQTSRHLFFATQVNDTNLTVQVIGKPYQELLDALVQEPSLQKYKLMEASLLAPKLPNAFNIEALSASPEGWLWIGFRNPIPDGKALLVPLKNPEQVVKGRSKPEFGEAVTFDFGGLGFRDMCYTQDRYYIVAGPYDKGICKLYSWDGKRDHAPQAVTQFASDFGAEIVIGFAKPSDKVLVICDDGSKKINGTDNKKLPLEQRTFRGQWVNKPQP